MRILKGEESFVIMVDKNEAQALADAASHTKCDQVTKHRTFFRELYFGLKAHGITGGLDLWEQENGTKVQE